MNNETLVKLAEELGALVIVDDDGTEIIFDEKSFEAYSTRLFSTGVDYGLTVATELAVRSKLGGQTNG